MLQTMKKEEIKVEPGLPDSEGRAESECSAGGDRPAPSRRSNRIAKEVRSLVYSRSV